MATSKTLTPTNQTISIPELSDAPDMSVAADAIGKEADAINALSDHIEYALTSGSLKTYATNAPGGFSCFRYNNSVTDTPCDYGHGYLIKYGQNYRFEVYDMVSLNAYTAYSNNSGSTWSEWLSLSEQIGSLAVVAKTVPANGSLAITVKSSCQAFIIAFGQGGARNAYIVRQSGSSAPGVLELATSANLSYSINSNVITFTNSTGTAVTLNILTFNGIVS